MLQKLNGLEVQNPRALKLPLDWRRSAALFDQRQCARALTSRAFAGAAIAGSSFDDLEGRDHCRAFDFATFG